MGYLQSDEQRDIIVVIDCPALHAQDSMHNAMASKLTYDSATSKVDLSANFKLDRTSECINNYCLICNNLYNFQ